MQVRARLSTQAIPVYRNVMSDKDEKQARLAQALRENLRRRKAQAREIKTDQEPSSARSDTHQSPNE